MENNIETASVIVLNDSAVMPEGVTVEEAVLNLVEAPMEWITNQCYVQGDEEEFEEEGYMVDGRIMVTITAELLPPREEDYDS